MTLPAATKWLLSFEQPAEIEDRLETLTNVLYKNAPQMRLPVLAVHQTLVAAIDIDAPEKSSEASMLKLKKKPKKPNGVVDYDPTSVV